MAAAASTSSGQTPTDPDDEARMAQILKTIRELTFSCADTSPQPSSRRNALLLLLRAVAITLCSIIFKVSSRSGGGPGSSSSSAAAGKTGHQLSPRTQSNSYWSSLTAGLFAECFQSFRLVFPNNGKEDNSNELAQLLVRCFGGYQQPQLQSSMLIIILEIGVADPLLLVNIMGKCARRVDLGRGPGGATTSSSQDTSGANFSARKMQSGTTSGPGSASNAYSSNALFVLCAFLPHAPDLCVAIVEPLVEAVLRCLEPSDPTLRKLMLLPATQALHTMVTALPMCAFHQGGQLYAVGTPQGSLQIYDLRTATRWRAFELPPIDVAMPGGMPTPLGATGALAAQQFAEARQGGLQQAFLPEVLALAFTDEGDKLAAYDASGRLTVWRTAAAGLLDFFKKDARLQTKVLGPPLARSSNWLKLVGIQWRGPSLVQIRRENGVALTINCNEQAIDRSLR